MKALFVLHEATRTGAPLMLLSVLKWMQKNKKFEETHLLIMKSGVLEEDFKNICTKVYKVSEARSHESYLTKIYYKLVSYIGHRTTSKTRYLRHISNNKYDFIYGNCAPTLDVALKIKANSLNSKLILHIHELEVVLKMHLNKQNNKLHLVDQFIAASYLVKDNLVNLWNVNDDKVDVVYECTEYRELETTKKVDNLFIVGASGSVQWRKGDDIFLQVARYINKQYPEVKMKFVWVGANYKKDIIEEDLKKLNLNIEVAFVGEQRCPETYYKEFSVFLMTSREDPFPLVCIEMAKLETPIICFKGATGTEEFLERGGGKIVPYLDIEAMAESVIDYYNIPDDLKADGKKAKQLFAQLTPENIGLEIFENIEKVVSGAQ